METPHETPHQPNANGGRLKVGNPGNKGGGALPEEYKTWCRQAAYDPAVRVRIEQQLKEGDPFPSKLWSLVADRGFGRPKETVEVTGKLLLIDDV